EYVVESAVVGYPHDVKGQGIYAYVICKDGVPEGDLDRQRVEGSIIEAVVAQIGRIAKPDKIQLVSGLPKTRSGKIMRRILRKQILLDEPYQLEANTPLMITILPKPADEAAAWQQFALQNLARAYEADEVEYTVADLKEPNPEYRAG
nr:acetyl-coenzyme A synthetase, chloroplastic/glyoxysomal [Tanacetum cinerariifolium]